MNPNVTVVDHGEGDEPLSNPSQAPHFNDVLAANISRRGIIKGGSAAALMGFFGANSLANAVTQANQEAAPQLIGFDAIPVHEQDVVTVAEGYRVTVLTPWGQPITEDAPEFALDNSGADQAKQIGQHHDGMHFFPIEGDDPYQGSSTDGLLVMNHEYVEPRFLHASSKGQQHHRGSVMLNNNQRDADEVLKEMNAHGVSIVRVRQQEPGVWDVVMDPRNRRVTATTEMQISGPVRGSDFVKTKFSPDGTATRGTINNCAHGVTPWNTYMAAEENWAGYFVNHAERPREQARYGVRGENTGRYAWELADANNELYQRFDVTPKGANATEDYRNEANCFGWMVEIDPFNPNSTPVKRTALGRFAHEGVVFQPAVEGQPIVAYSGDDARNEYIYKYVSAQPYFKATAGGHLLDNGTLYVARFHNNGSGEWLPLVFGQGPLTPANGFHSQADVLVNTRAAADLLGATPMDRPEWGAVHPETKQVYFTLTNNTARTVENVDGANPRANNRWGQIVRWTERGDLTSKHFDWDLFIMAGPEGDSEFAGESLTEDNIFNSPDGLWIDARGLIWIQTDISESVMNTGDHAQFGNNQMLACDPINNTLKRFLVGPVGQEVTGVITTPDMRTMFVNLQHPGATTTAEDFAQGKLTSHWPDGGDAYPRSATLVITKVGPGVIGS